jgi:hypothetical protein
MASITSLFSMMSYWRGVDGRLIRRGRSYST